MNYMKNIADLLGVEMNEFFDIEYNSGKYSERFFLTNDGLLCTGDKYYAGDVYLTQIFEGLLTGRCSIIKN